MRLEDGIRVSACARTVKAVLDKALNRVGGILVTVSCLFPNNELLLSDSRHLLEPKNWYELAIAVTGPEEFVSFSH